jgi:hypothetical protein
MKEESFYLFIVPLIFLLLLFNNLFMESVYNNSVIRECSTKKYYKLTSRTFIKCEAITYEYKN